MQKSESGFTTYTGAVLCYSLERKSIKDKLIYFVPKCFSLLCEWITGELINLLKAPVNTRNGRYDTAKQGNETKIS